MKRMFVLNPTRLRTLPVLVILLYDSSKGVTHQDSQKCY